MSDRLRGVQLVLRVAVIGIALGATACTATSQPATVRSGVPDVPPISSTALQAALQEPAVAQAMVLKRELGHKKQAASLFKQAADRGNPVAQAELGRMHAIGLGAGAELDAVAAVALFKQAANQGYAPAEVALGQAYRTGAGISEDAVLAAHWYRLAAAQDLPSAEALYGLALFAGDDIATDQQRGRALIAAAAGKGSGIAILVQSALDKPEGPPTPMQLGNLAHFIAGFPTD
jgi:TPR repeat protein